MKKLLLITSLVIGVVVAMNAQPRAIGVRLGGNLDFSYQHQLNKNMLDCTFGAWFGKDHMSLNAVVMYDFIFPITSHWNWYVGPGAGIGLGLGSDVDDRFNLNIGGQIGIEYQFNIPLNLSLDYRPMINVLGFGGDNWGNWYGIALGIRYRF